MVSRRGVWCSPMRTPDQLPADEGRVASADRARAAWLIRQSVEGEMHDPGLGGFVERLVEGRTASVPMGRSTDRPESGCVHDAAAGDRAVA